MQNRYHSRTRSISVALISDQIVEPGHNFTLTASFEGFNASSYDALVIPGGRAPEYLALDESVIKLVKEFMEVGKLVASICHGQQILSAAGALKGKKCTAFPAVKLNVVLGGATWLEPDPISRIWSLQSKGEGIRLLSRVVQLAHGERLNLKSAVEFHYLSQSGCLAIDDVDDARKFQMLMEALDTVRLCKEDQDNAFEMLAAVLWLGNISFQVIDNENHVEVVADEGGMVRDALWRVLLSLIFSI
ncbi:hypothetical protein HYC85_016181 [Camellia sinensis]|uniref:Myosin motor domain-containing protein n=1 Tax=Camellia sinensis TaxID=4442 RepID=A0A7J7GYV4_CAMSI|nr:hypothetical protein HYC85_016181 [Camellia sinensis]